MAERSFKEEVAKLRLGAGEEFRGEGILAVTKALLQSGVSYVSGYQGAPISHLVDVLADANDMLQELGIRFEASANEASAAATLAASINYPLRGAATFKSTVGTNVASDALANLASSGVTGGALVIVGEDYGEGSSIMQERSHAFAMKSQIWLLDPRPNLPSIVNAVEQGFALSEASNTPVMLELRIRACHVYGSFTARDNVRPSFTLRDAMEHPVRDTNRVVLPPASYLQEKEKVEKRWPAAVQFVQEHKLNEFFDGDASDIGIVMQGGMYNTALRALEVLGLADVFGESRIPLYVLNVTYPLIDAELVRFCAGKQAILVIEEGQPEFIEQAINTILRRADVQARVEGKGMLPMAGEYTGGVMKEGLRKFVAAYRPDLLDDGHAASPLPSARLARAQQSVAGKVHGRPPSFCTGCPERPIFAAMKLVERELGPHHVSCDIGCHLFSVLPPFNIGNSTMGYGLGGAGAAAFNVAADKRTIALVGDGGFWHNGLASSVGNSVFNKSDNVLIVVDNGYAAATGGQDVLSSAAVNAMRSTRNPIEKAVRGVGVNWVRTLTRTYDVAKMRDTLKEALTTAAKGPKVIIAQSECMLNKQRRIRPLLRKMMAGGERVVRERFGVDPDTCTGDHSCIRLSGCPSLTLAPNPDPLRREPVTKVINSCVGCGLCGEVAHAAVLCPSFYRASIIANPTWWDRAKQKVRGAVIGWLQRRLILLLLSMDARVATVRPITIAIVALGGEGGGVLADWIVDLAQHGGYLAQATSVPGVAQRTGATVYYVELFPKTAAQAAGRDPVLALMPVPGDVDVVLASELMEAARAVERGFVTPDKTLLIASTHRVFAMTEKIALADGRADAAALLVACRDAARQLVAFDMEALADATGSVLSAVLFGTLAGSGALPFPRPAFEAAIRRGGVGVSSSLAAFGAGFEAAQAGEVSVSATPTVDGDKDHADHAVRDLLLGVERDFIGEARPIAVAGVERLIDYQDLDYAREFLARLERFRDIERQHGDGSGRLLAETARQLALGMAYEDTIRVADLKTRASRFARVREEAKIEDGQILEIVEFFHPRTQEIADTLPAGLGRWLVRTPWARGLLDRLTRKGKTVKTTSLSGFVLLYLLSRLRPLRRRSLRFVTEQAALASWLDLIAEIARTDYSLALQVARMRSLVKGYGDTHERGRAKFDKLVALLPGLRAYPNPGAVLDGLIKAALADEGGQPLDKAIAGLIPTPTSSPAPGAARRVS